MKEITRELLRASGDRYSGLRKYVGEGNEDIRDRLEFLIKNARGSILDVGVYDGYFVHELATCGFEVTATDMMEEAILLFEKEREQYYPNSKAKLHIAYAENLPFEDSAFDTVIISHTLEHVFDPVLSLRECVRVCKNLGRIIIIVPPDIGNDPTHVRVVKESWVRHELSHNKCHLQETSIVGNGVAYIAQKM